MTLDLTNIEVAELIVALDRYAEQLALAADRGHFRPEALSVRANLAEALADQLSDALIDADGTFAEDPLDDLEVADDTVGEG